MIIDTHTHFYDPTRPQGVPWPSPDSGLLYRPVLPAHFRQVSAASGVTGTVVVEASAWLEDNQWILDLAAADPVIVGLVGHVDPGREGFGENLARFAPHPLFLGIRCGGGAFAEMAKGSLLRDLERLVDAGLELDALVSKGQFPGVAAVAERLPELRIVLNHTGHVPIDGGPPDPEWVDGIERLAAFPRVYMKVSAVLEQSRVQPAPADPAYYAPTLEAMWQAFGEDRLLYGSNWPVCERAGDYATAFRVVEAFFDSRGKVARDKYFWRNAVKAYGCAAPDGAGR